jgi:predicted RNA-binding Zn-ribbon protein involved in translation (DUF1610 family)
MEKYNTFYCPHCFGYLNIADKIIFKVKSKSNELGLMMLSAKISDYTSEASEAIKKVEKELYEFYCPLCSKCLNLESSEMRLVKLYMKDKNKKKYEIYFSGIFGEHCTYVVKDCNLEYFGPHSKIYMDQLEKYKEYYERHL